ncbi:Transcriptional response regulator CssR [Candidatus Syntrophocurvum alkaliphilum]|uniref:Stage 0 sporulation protein A homolog n=1 Tax=Candidatus Syntrophocurvum alkaliphilum TaxID=2293317 RepID=A0A6I6DB43_9FIRM|nr:response regulator transcription factor [Candidatus Syntrophocurvum alkaliphilum]QGT98675.1 Transcriptional response regulator CssR [Candidatus Syntrophocurvum alkaliphilum]
MSIKINLVEDDTNLNLILTSYLEKEGWDVTSFFTGEAAKKAITPSPDLWILDIMLPDIDGYELIKEIKKTSQNLPVIFISARDADIDRVVGLELGSDDYLSKPFLPRELVIRTKKLIERVYQNKQTILSIFPYTVNEITRTVLKDDKEIELTSKEFDLVLYFAKNIGAALSREQILNYIWEDNYIGTDRVVDDLIRRLRKKMPELRIETIYGYGYRMVKS